jgi:hypothetical protein
MATNRTGQARRSATAGKPLNVRINRFVSQVITPVVLLAGLLLLILLHFRGVLATTLSQDDLYRGQRSFSVGNLQETFMLNAGTDRPGVSWGDISVLSWVEWSSTIAIDGNVSNLWDNYHGYDYDAAKRQVFSTVSGRGWQLIEIVTLVDAHTLTVNYQFVARRFGTAEPHHVVIAIEHFHKALYQPTVAGTTLTAGVLPGSVSSFTNGMTVHTLGTLTLAVSSARLAPNGISIDDLQGNVTASGSEQTTATAFTTTYTIDNPTVDRLLLLGTETLTYVSAVGAATPIPAVPTPQG